MELVGLEVDERQQVDSWAVLWPRSEAVDPTGGEIEVEGTALASGDDGNGLDRGFVGRDWRKVACARAVAGEVEFETEAFGGFRGG